MTNTTVHYPQSSEVSIQVRRAQAGDRNAFDQLAGHYRPLLFALAFLRTSHKEEAEDLVQDVLTKAWQKLPTLTEAASFLPWLKTIMAHACISWHRRTRMSPRYLNDEPEDQLLTDKGIPLESLLERDRQRRLHHALLTLPEANRLALLMHLWGHASYEDIAAFTGVPASTVDGRIYRAKRLLRRLLSDSGAGFFGEGHRQWQSPTNPINLDDVLSQRRNKMSLSQTTDAANHREQQWALAVFTRRFSLLLDAGVSLSRTLELLQEMPDPYGTGSRNLRTKVEQGECLSQAMSEWPNLFSPVYVGMIRAGEVGGVLEETVQRLKKVLAREWNLANQHPREEMPLFLLLPADKPVPEKWEGLSAYQQTVTFSLFFETFGTLLQSGVPILQAMETVADLLPPASREGWKQAREQVRMGLPFTPQMARMGIFPGFALEMIQTGEESGSLDGMLHSLAESFEDDLDYQTLPQTV